MKIKGVETNLEGIALIRALLKDEFGYKHTCACGKEQTEAGCKSMLKIAKEKGIDSIDNDFVCHTCRNSKSITLFGKTYASIKEAAEATYGVEHSSCEICGKTLSKVGWYEWCKRYAISGDTRVVCRSCTSSEVRIALNERDHDKLSQMVRERNLKNWQNEDYRKAKSEAQVLVAKKMWADRERKYGENGDLTFAELRHETAASQWTNNEKTYGPDSNLTFKEYMTTVSLDSWDKPEFWNTLFISHSPYKVETSLTDEEVFHKTISQIDILYNKYIGLYPNSALVSESFGLLLNYTKDKLASLGLKSELYLKYIATLPFGGNHHIILRSLYVDDFLTVKVTPMAHTKAHFFLVLDNFNSINNINMRKDSPNNQLTYAQIKAFQSLSIMANTAKKDITDKTLLRDINTIIS